MAVTTVPHISGRRKVAMAFSDIAQTYPNSGHSRYENGTKRTRCRTNSLKVEYDGPREYVLASVITVSWRMRPNVTDQSTVVVRTSSKAECWLRISREPAAASKVGS